MSLSILLAFSLPDPVLRWALASSLSFLCRSLTFMYSQKYFPSVCSSGALFFCEMQSRGGGEGSAGNVVKVKAQNSLTKYFLFFLAFSCFNFFFFVVVNSQFSFSLWHVPREFISCRRTEKIYVYQRSLNRRQGSSAELIYDGNKSNVSDFFRVLRLEGNSCV